MSRMTIAVDLDGFDRVRARLQGMRERSQNLIPAWEAFVTWWARENRQQWRGNGTRWGRTWAPLAPSTIREKRLKGYPLDTLVRTGALRRDLTVRPLGFESYAQQAVSAGTRISYAKFHQRGTSKMPARPIVNVAQVDAENAAGSAVKNWIVNGIASVNPTETLRR